MSEPRNEIQRRRILYRLTIGLVVLALLTPLGLWLPQLLGSGAAWGEWSSDELARMIGYVPKGLQRLESIWTKALFPDYEVLGGKSALPAALGYVISALVGIALVAGVSYLLGRGLASPENKAGEQRQEEDDAK